MIPRYTRPEMGALWTQEASYDRWLLIEIAATEAWSDDGLVPKADAAKVARATYGVDRLNEILQKTKHPMTAFLTSVTEKLVWSNASVPTIPHISFQFLVQ